MQLTASDGTKISYQATKISDVFLIFLHGWGVNWTTWKESIEFFQKQGYSTVALDLRGHGESGKPGKRSAYDISSFSKDIDELARIENIQKSALIGQSMGGMIALDYALRYPGNVLALILCNSTYMNVLEHRKFKGTAPLIKKIIKKVHDDSTLWNPEAEDIDLSKLKKESDYKIFTRGMHNATTLSLISCLEHLIDFDVKDSLAKINAPVLIISGEEDNLLPPIDSEEMHELIPKNELKKIKGSHFLNIKNTKEVNELILEFLKKNNILANKY
ncbi:MAG: alpha/beta hydrolase [Nanoarchaeota archaeon]